MATLMFACHRKQWSSSLRAARAASASALLARLFAGAEINAGGLTA